MIGVTLMLIKDVRVRNNQIIASTYINDTAG
jgi:hypothetical protein